ncbi:Exocyst complex protein exo70 [Pleurostoma richardsiae]|uniref:Exocyst complex protein exo70 n=1 Tax=Pleurostoma richardsiae TaxID=41990 RepID=A0AA38VIS4_9PEZI|nr:Exocyst complex protein exo70 [Pleurostoma richardsiae]
MVRKALAQSGSVSGSVEAHTSSVLHRHLHLDFPFVARGEGSHLILEDGRKIFDACGGAAVTCLGHGDVRVNQAMVEQINKISYCASTFFTTRACEELADELISSTDGHMARAYIVNSGSEAMESAMKLARQYFLEKENAEPRRIRFIARNQSFHGTTLGSLAMGGHVYRRAKFEPMLIDNVSKVSPCFAYRGRLHNETDKQYVERLALELDQQFQKVGPDTVCAFVAEPVVGAALGCVPSVPGYFTAMRSICERYGALLILDEVMCGMGRTGTHHAWQQEGVVPDIQTIGKCLGGGYQPVAGLLISKQIVDALSRGTGGFTHGHTYQGHPVGCAAALKVQRIIREDGLLANVRAMGALLSSLLHEKLGGHPNVGDIRGRGLFWALEFVADKTTAAPFPVEANVAMDLSELGLTAEYGMAVYPGTGTYDGIQGDHIIISPAYTVTEAEVRLIAETISRLVNEYFSGKTLNRKLPLR